MIEIRTTSIVVKRTRLVPMAEASSYPACELKPVPSLLPPPAQPLRKWRIRSSRAIPSRSSSCQVATSRLSSAISASVTRGESRRQATHCSRNRVLMATHPPPWPQCPSTKPSRSFEAFGHLLAAKLRWPDALFGDLHALDALEAEEQFDEVRRRLGGDPLHDRPERFLHVLAESDALDCEAAQVHLDALVRLKHARVSGIRSSRLEGLHRIW